MKTMVPTDPALDTAPDPDFRSGFIALLGEPNVGKSTLVNALLDFKIAIVSSKPQTTRDRIKGIFTDETCQIVFVDAPGVMEPQDRFNECLRDSALEALGEADAVLHLIDAARPRALPQAAREALGRLKKPVLLVFNKTDKLKNADALTELSQPDAKRKEAKNLAGGVLDVDFYRDVFFISAQKSQGLDALMAGTRLLLPPGPMLYDPDQMTDRDMRYLAAEVVREKILENIEQEVPYAVATQTEEYVEREPKYLVRVVIFVEHESQKGIVIGDRGERLRKIGSAARPAIEELADHPVFLELWVKVRKNWRKRENDLREFGYQSQRKKRKAKRRRR